MSKSGIKVRLEMNPQHALAVRGLSDANPIAQRRFTSLVARLSDPYMPFQSGGMKNQKTAEAEEHSHMADKNQKTIETSRIIYRSPYARYHYYGKLMVGVFSRSSWAMRGERKVVTGKNLTYHGAPMRGPNWAKRMWIDRGDEIIRKVAEITGGHPG